MKRTVETRMNEAEQRALLTVALLAAHADGLKDESERASIRRLADRLGNPNIDIAAIERDIEAGSVRLADAVRPLATALTVVGRGYDPPTRTLVVCENASGEGDVQNAGSARC